MSYQHERDQFIISASRDHLPLWVISKLLRHATTLQRLAVAQCNGNWPYNGDRDRPSSVMANLTYSLTSADLKARWDKHYTVCPNCETSGVAKSAMRYSDRLTADCPTDDCTNAKQHKQKVCPDCRTQELIHNLLEEYPEVVPVFDGDPREAVLKLSTPHYPYAADGSNGANGLYVPVRSR